MKSPFNQDDLVPVLSRPGTSFICQACCDNGIIEAVGGGILIFHCPDHMTLCIKDGEVISAQTNGIRQ